MLHFFFADHAEWFQLFNLLNYITFRTGGALFTSFLVTILLGPWLITWLKSKQGKGQPIREDGPQRHIVEKAGTPTMGGLLIFVGILAGVFMFGDLMNGHLWAVLSVTIGFGLIGFADDFSKVTKQHSGGLSGKTRLLGEFLIAALAVLWLMLLADYQVITKSTALANNSKSADKTVVVDKEQKMLTWSHIENNQTTLTKSQGFTHFDTQFRGEQVELYRLELSADALESLQPLNLYAISWSVRYGLPVKKGDTLFEFETLSEKYIATSPQTGIFSQKFVSTSSTASDDHLNLATPDIFISIKPDILGWQRLLNGYGSRLALPFVKDIMIPLGVVFILFGCLVIVGTSNAVNLTDGLDGLAIVPVMIAVGSFGFISYLVGNAIFADYLQLHYVKGTGELAVLMGAILGAGLGFLWFNAPPAMVFMGDTGSLSLGATLGATAVATKNELVLVIIGGLFVLEAVSVFLQVLSFKLTGKRLFAMAPIHHHFEKKGWPESQIVIRFWIIALALALIGLATLKLR